ncbi:hypothetical protein [Halomonas sp. M20]|uniref:hypothetical protein n=1 Tax=Halomonas sp. M20 TaxID=2763264 RepID=UPI001D0AA74E|nr:hypothetical protein [Halomonas sp. M20]
MSWQVPKHQDSRRDEAAIDHWREQLRPELKKDAKVQNETLILVDESSFHLCSHPLKTFASVRQTPVIKGKRGQSLRHIVIDAVSSEGCSYFHWTSGTAPAQASWHS